MTSLQSSIIIGLTGHKQVGKDTIADYLCRTFGFKKLAFANPLKNAAREVFGFSDAQLYGDQKEVIDPFWNVTPREVLQVVGTDLFRLTLPQFIPQIGNQIWTRTLERQLQQERLQNPRQSFVVTDVRYPNEAEVVHRFGGILMRVERPDLTSGLTLGGQSFAAHLSETAMNNEPSDLLIRNNGSIDQLFVNVNFIVESMFNKREKMIHHEELFLAKDH